MSWVQRACKDLVVAIADELILTFLLCLIRCRQVGRHWWLWRSLLNRIRLTVDWRTLCLLLKLHLLLQGLLLPFFKKFGLDNLVIGPVSLRLSILHLRFRLTRLWVNILVNDGWGIPHDLFSLHGWFFLFGTWRFLNCFLIFRLILFPFLILNFLLQSLISDW